MLTSSQTDSPSSIDEADGVGPLRSSRGSYVRPATLFHTLDDADSVQLSGYVRPYAETVTDDVPSRHNTVDSAKPTDRRSNLPKLRTAQAGIASTTSAETDDETIYQTAVESHEDDEAGDAVEVDDSHQSQVTEDKAQLMPEQS